MEIKIIIIIVALVFEVHYKVYLRTKYNNLQLMSMLMWKYFDILLVQQKVIKFKDEYNIIQFQQQTNHWSLRYDFWGHFLLSWNETFLFGKIIYQMGFLFLYFWIFFFAYIKVRGFSFFYSIFFSLSNLLSCCLLLEILS